MLLLCLISLARCQYEFPEIRRISGGIFGWNSITSKIAGLFDGMQISSYKILSKVDLNKGAEETAKSISDDDLLITDYIKKVIDTANLSFEVDEDYNLHNYANMDGVKDVKLATFNYGTDTKTYAKTFIKNSLESATEEDVKSDDYLYSLGIGIGFTSVLLIIFFIIDFFVFLVLCCTCCCGKPKDRASPTCCQTVFFVLGVICIFCVALFAFLCIPASNDIKDFIVNVNEYVPAIARNANESVNSMEDVIGDLIDDIPSYAYNISNKVDIALEVTSNEIKSYTAAASDDISDFFANAFGDESSFTQKINEINDLIEQLNQKGEMTIDKVDVAGNINSFEQTLLDTVDDAEGIIDDLVDSAHDSLSEINDKLDDMNINKTLDKKRYFDKLREYVDEYVDFNLTDEIFKNDQDTKDLVNDVIDYLNQYWWGVNILFALIGLFFISIILCWTFTFINKCCCCRCCCTRCFVCFPCCQILFILVFGILSTALLFVFVTLGSDLFDAGDTFITKAADYVQPNRAIEVPQFSAKLTAENETYAVTVPDLKFQFDDKITKFSDFFDSSNVGLSTFFDLKEFFNIDTIVNTVNTMGANLTDIIKDTASSIAGTKVDEHLTKFTQFTNISEIDGAFNINDRTQDASEKAKDCMDNTDLSADTREICRKIYEEKIPELKEIYNGDVNDELNKAVDNIKQHLVYRINSTGFPTFYDITLKPTIDDVVEYIFGKAGKLINLIPDIIDSFKIDLVRGPIALVYNIINDFATFAAYASLTLHLSLLGYFFAGIALKMRLPHLGDKNMKASAEDDDDDESEIETFDDDRRISERKAEKEKKNSKKSNMKSMRSAMKHTSYSSESESDSGSSSLRKRQSKRQQANSKTPKAEMNSKSSSDEDSSFEKQESPKPVSRKNSRAPTASNQNGGSFWLDY